MNYSFKYIGNHKKLIFNIRPHFMTTLRFSVIFISKNFFCYFVEHNNIWEGVFFYSFRKIFACWMDMWYSKLWHGRTRDYLFSLINYANTQSLWGGGGGGGLHFGRKAHSGGIIRSMNIFRPFGNCTSMHWIFCMASALCVTLVDMKSHGFLVLFSNMEIHMYYA